MGKLVIGDIVSLFGANFSNYQSIPPNLQNENTSPKSWRKFSDWQHCPILINALLQQSRVPSSSHGKPKFQIKNQPLLNVYIGAKDIIQLNPLLLDLFF